MVKLVLTKATFLSMVLLLGIVAPVNAAVASFFFQFDENGNGFFSINGGPGIPIHPCANAADIGCWTTMLVGGVNNALTYILPADPATPGVSMRVTNGDVAVTEPMTPAGTISDGLRFTDMNGSLTGMTADRMAFFSEVEIPPEPVIDRADTGLPQGFAVANRLAIVAEVGTEGDNRFQFGGTPAIPFTYVGISDIPEPGTLTLLTPICLALLLILRFRSKQPLKERTAVVPK